MTRADYPAEWSQAVCDSIDASKRDHQATMAALAVRLNEPKPAPETNADRLRNGARDARLCNIIGSKPTAEQQRNAVFQWLVPTQARSVFYGQTDRDTALWLICRMAERWITDDKPTPLELDSSLGWHLENLRVHSEILTIRLQREIDSMLNAAWQPPVILAALAKQSAASDFGDLDLADLIRERVRAWEHRNRSRNKGNRR